MNYILKRIIIALCIIISLSPQIFSIEDEFNIFHPTYFNEQNSIFETIHYLENELLSFEICPKQEVNINSKIICSSGEEIELELFEKENGDKSCYFTNKNFEEISCSDFTLYTSYVQNEKERIITRDFEEERESKLLNYILEKDVNTLNSLDLSYYLLTLNMIQDQTTQETVEAYEKLKNTRDNTNKCWPENNCDLLTTAKILNNIKVAQYDDDSRLLEDGEIYLKNKVITEEDISFTSTTNSNGVYEVEIKINHEFAINEEIECDLDLDFGDEEKSYTFDEDSDLEELRIHKNAEENIDFSCDSEVDEITISTFEETISEDFIENDDNVDFEISENDKDDFFEFNLEMQIKHEFAINEEIECTLDIDDGTQTDYTFDEDSELEDLLIQEELDESFEFECDDDLEEMFYIIYGGTLESETETEVENLEYGLEANEEDEFNFELYLEYDFKNDNDEIECKIKTDDTIKSQTFDEDDEENNEIKISKYSASNSLSISCDKKINKITYKLFDKFGREQIEEVVEEVVSKSYSIPNDFSQYSCFSKSDDCEFETTLLANSLLSTNFDDKNKVENFLKSFNKKDSSDLIFIDDTDKKIELSGKFLYYFDNDDIQDSLKFIQNNDGSWGSKTLTDKILDTTWSAIGLTEQERDSEYLDDAKKWVYFNEPTTGWSSIEKNTLAYLTIEEQIKPYLKISTINTIENNNILLTIENPTIFSIKNIEIDFGTQLNEKLSFKQTIEELNQNEKEEINISLLSGFSGTEDGELIITGFNNKKEIELIRVPISISAPFPFKFQSNNINIIEGEIYTEIPLSSDIETFSLICLVQNPFEKRSEQFTITQDTKEIKLSNIMQEKGKFSVELNCDSEDGKTFSKIETIDVDIIPKTFTINSPDINLFEVKKDFSISVTNNAQEPQTLEFEITGDYSEIIIITEESKIIALNETRNIYFSVNNSEQLANLGEVASGLLTIKSGEYKKDIPLYYSQPIEEKLSIPWLWITLGIIIIFMTLFVIRRYNQLKQEQENSQEYHEDEDELFLDEDIEFK